MSSQTRYRKSSTNQVQLYTRERDTAAMAGTIRTTRTYIYLVVKKKER